MGLGMNDQPEVPHAGLVTVPWPIIKRWLLGGRNLWKLKAVFSARAHGAEARGTRGSAG